VDLLGGGEEIEEERDGEEGDDEEEAFGLGLEMRFRVCVGWGEEVHTRVQLGTVGRDVGGGRRPRLEIRHFFSSSVGDAGEGPMRVGFHVMGALFGFWWRVVVECDEVMIINEFGFGKKRVP
jgi:hypothetical protein